jgi:hypothetical protein
LIIVSREKDPEEKLQFNWKRAHDDLFIGNGLIVPGPPTFGL